VDGQEPESKWVQARGLRLHCADWGGEGLQPLVLLHGLQDCARLWDYLAAPLSDRFHVLALDHRGHGDSPRADSYGLEDYVGEAGDFIAALGLENVLLVGHSAGGKNAFIHTARHPERITRLVIVDMDPDAFNPGSATMFQRYNTESDEYSDLDAVVERLRSRQPGSTEEILRHCAVHLTKPSANGGLTWKRDRTLLARYERPGAWAYLPRITVPTLIVRGSDSDLLTQPVAERMQREIPDCRLELIEGGGHWSHLERPDVFLHTVRPFLEG
jgi:esterase